MFVLVGSTLDRALMVEKLINQSAVGTGVTSNGNDDDEEDDVSDIKGSAESDSGWNDPVLIYDVVAVVLLTVRRSIVTVTRGMTVAMETSVVERGAESLESSSPFPIIPEKFNEWIK